MGGTSDIRGLVSEGLGSRISGGEVRKRWVSMDWRWLEDAAGGTRSSKTRGGEEARIGALARFNEPSSGTEGV